MSVWRKSWPSRLRLRLLTMPWRHRALEPQRVAHRKHRVTGIDVVSITQDDVARFQVGRERQLEQSQIDERIERDDLDVFDPAPAEPARDVHVQDRRDPALTLNDVIVGDRIPVLVDEEPRALAGRRLDRDHRLAKLADELLDRRWLQDARRVETRAVFLERPGARPRTSRRFNPLRSPQDLVLGDPAGCRNPDRRKCAVARSATISPITRCPSLRITVSNSPACSTGDRRRQQTQCRNDPQTAQDQVPPSLDRRVSPAIDWTNPHCKNHFDPFNPACSRLRPNNHDGICLFILPGFATFPRIAKSALTQPTVFRLDLNEPAGPFTSRGRPRHSIRSSPQAIAHRITGESIPCPFFVRARIPKASAAFMAG